MSGSRAALGHGAAALGCGLLLFAVGQPIVTDDFWWHLAYGRAFAESGPWLAVDPLLFAASGPPATASWLFDLALHHVARGLGFEALRALHALIVAAILIGVWRALRRASRCPVFASLSTLAFAAIAAYRLVQLRPELVSIAASLLVFELVIAGGSPPSWRRVGLVAALAALWANAHAGFALGLLLIGTALLALAVAAPWRSRAQRTADRARAARLAAALALAGVATLANPAGIGAHRAWFAAGGDTPELELVVDEWTRLDPFSLPALPGPPSPLSFALAWALAIATLAVIVRDRRTRTLDPAAVAVSLLGLALGLAAVRFLWLGIFPLLLIAGATGARATRTALRAARTRAAACVAAAVALAAAFPKLGDWPAITRGASPTAYQRPYAAAKYFSQAIWVIADSGARGNLYNDYFLGGFAGYWLAPDVRTIVNGTLNFPREIIAAMQAIGRRHGQRPGEDFPALLDRLGIDLFLGIGMPDVPVPGRRRRYAVPTTTHLENAPGWIPVFRNLESAVYLRANERNAGNLARFARYYARERVPFDPQRGFAVDAVLRDAPGWAIEHGVVPPGFARGERTASGHDARARLAADRVAGVDALVGRYEQAIEIDRRLLAAEPDASLPRRRLVWSLLALERSEQAAEVARGLASQPDHDVLAHMLAEVAIDAAAPRARRGALPFLYPAEARWLRAGLRSPAQRPPRERSRTASGPGSD